MMKKDFLQRSLGIVGLGYVGLPLALAFARKHDVVGFDISPRRIAELQQHKDRTRQASESALQQSTLRYTHEPHDLKACSIFIVTVPTPVNACKQPDLTPLISSSTMLGSVLKKGDVVVYESTVYPGATEEVCVPILEKESGLKYNQDFFCGYSPERINPGDTTHQLENIIKVTSGSTPEVAECVSALYEGVIGAGVHQASSIRVAEAAKIIENTQRDVNIALINELCMLFDTLKIPTYEVLEAAGTKWNFLPFKPGLVGGHCIGVDPYYLTYKAREVGYHPDMILAGRRINDGMATYMAHYVFKNLLDTDIHPKKVRILVIGFTFKEDCADVRNTQVLPLVLHLMGYGFCVDVWDPMVHADDYDDRLNFVQYPQDNTYHALILAVPHGSIAHDLEHMERWCCGQPWILDIKNAYAHHAYTHTL